MNDQDGEPPLLDEAVLAEMLDLIGGDLEILDDIIDTWLAEAPSLVDQLVSAESDGSVDDVYNVAHTLKSSSRSVGCMRIGALAEQIETAARAGQISNDAISAVPHALEGTVTDIASWRSSRS